ncbi:polymer-forming cytoskeletal protein, partial [bacterium]|nr:polymer-forming cytoskeletal protein [bacterium]
MFDKPRSSRSNENTADFSTSSPDLSSGITSPSRSVATLGESIIIKGDVTGNENLLVEGSIEGKVDLGNHELTIGQAGKVSADVKAKVVNIAGEVKGDIVGLEKVVISRAGNVQGTI